jgi:F0F1-type ATP synthase membrane subunit b/b'
MLKNKMKLLSLFIILMFSASGFVFAQVNDLNNNRNQLTTSAAELTQSLAVQLSLSPEQSDEIRKALYNYHEDIIEESHEAETDIIEERRENTEEETDRRIIEYSNEVSDSKESVNNKIENVLNETQVNRWNIIKDSWWAEVDSKIEGLKHPVSGEKDREKRIQDNY